MENKNMSSQINICYHTFLNNLCLQCFYFINYSRWENVYACGIHYDDNDMNFVFEWWNCDKTRTIRTKLRWRIKLKKIKAIWIKRFIKVTKSLDNVAVYRIFFMNVINQHIKCTNIFLLIYWCPFQLWECIFVTRL